MPSPDSLRAFYERSRQRKQDIASGASQPFDIGSGNRKAEFIGRINQARRDQGIIPGDSPLTPLVDPQMAEDFGRKAPGILGDVGGPVLGALAELSSPAEIAFMLGTAGFGGAIAGGLRAVPKVGKVLGMFAEPLANTFPKAFGAEVVVGVGGVLGAQEVIEHTQDLHPAARIPLTIAGGVLAAAATAGSPAVIRKTIQGAKMAGDLRYVDEAAEAYVKSRQTAEDPSFSGTINPGGSYGKTVDTEGRIVPDVEPEAPKTPSSRMTDSIIENATDDQLVKFRDDLEVLVNKSDVVVPDVEDQINTLNVELARRGSASTTDAPASTSAKIYHGTRATDTSTFINKNGDLVLRKSSNFGGRQDGVSFTDSLESAQEYATRSTTPSGESLAAVRQYDGTVFEIDKDAAGDLVPEAMGELFADGRDVIIPKGKFRALDTKGLAPTVEPDADLANKELVQEIQELRELGDDASIDLANSLTRILRERLEPEVVTAELELLAIKAANANDRLRRAQREDTMDLPEARNEVANTKEALDFAIERSGVSQAERDRLIRNSGAAQATEKFLDESPNRKKVLRDENIADIKDPVLRAINRQVEEARVRAVIGSGVTDGPVSNIVGLPGADGRRMRASFDLSDDARIRSLAPIFGKHFRTVDATDGWKLHDALDNLPLTNMQRGLINSMLFATGFDRSVKVEKEVIKGLKSNQFGTPEELVKFARGEGRSLTIREAAELTSRNTHTFLVTNAQGERIANIIMTKERGVAADGSPLFDIAGRGYETDPSKLRRVTGNEYEILIEALSPAGETLSLRARDRVNKQSLRQIMEVADEMFRQTDADVIKGTRVTGARRGSGKVQKITKEQVHRYFNRSVVTGNEAEMLQDAKNNWNRPSSTDDAVIAQMESDRFARKVMTGADDGGEPPPPGTYTGFDPDDLTPRARASEAALGDSTEINTWEPWGQDAQRLFTASRTYEAAAVAKGVSDGAKFAKARGIKKWNRENALPLFRALHDPDKWLNKLPPEMQEIYYDLRRNWVFKEENDMFTFLSFAAERNASQFKIDMEQMAARFMAHPHYFNRIWRYFDQIEGETLHKMWKTSGTAKDPRPGFETTMEQSRNAKSFDEMVKFGYEPALWDPYKMAAQRRMSGVEYRESIRFLTRLAERGLEDHTGAKAGDPRWAIPSGIPLFNGALKTGADGEVVRGPVIHVPTEMANWMEQVWTSPHTIFSDPVLFDKSIKQWSTITKLTKLAISPFQHGDMLWRAGGALFTPTGIISPMMRGGSDRLGLDRLTFRGKSLDRFSVPTGRLPGPMKIPSLMVDMFKVQFFTSARKGTSEFMISPTRINKDYPLLWQDLVQKHGLVVHGDYSILAEDMRDGIVKILQPRIDPVTGKKVWLYPGAPLGAAKTMTRAINKLNDFFVSGLFDGVYSVVMKYAIENFALPAMRRNHPNWTVDQVGGALAENINTIFSALANFQTFLKNIPPSLQQALQIAAFSTGETEGLMRSAARAFIPRRASRKAIAGGEGVREIPANTQRGIPYRRSKKLVMSPHWGIHAEHMLGMFTVLAITANVIHKFATGKGNFEEGEWLHERMGAGVYNPINSQDPYAVIGTLGYNGGFVSPLSPWGKGRNGTDVYLDLVGQQDTAFKWLLSPLDAISSRYNVLPRALYNQLQGETFNGIPLTTPLQRVGALVSDLSMPISAINAIAGLRKAHPGLYGISSFTLPGEDRLTPVQLGVQGGGQNLKAINNQNLQMQIDLLPKNSKMRKQFEIEIQLRKVEGAIKGQGSWVFIRSKTIKDAYEYWHDDTFMLEELDKAVDGLADKNSENARNRKDLMPRWRYRELGYSYSRTLQRDKKDPK